MNSKQKAMRLATSLLKGFINIVGGKKATVITSRLAEELIPIISQSTDYGEVKFYCPGRTPEYRARTLLTKEPETIEWINSFDKNDVLWDIGANVGVYSLYAALRNIKVCAFEPSPGNYYLLGRNIEINNMDDKISSFCIAFNDTTRLDSLFMINTELGGALNSFEQSLDWEGKPYNAAYKQSMIGYSIDDFVEQFNPTFPNHIKIDVDGNENKIIEGAKKTLADTRLKSVFIELNVEREDYCNNVISILKEAGIELYKKEHAPQFEDSIFSKVYNHIFVRQEKASKTSQKLNVKTNV